jgi:hypothetical protein
MISENMLAVVRGWASEKPSRGQALLGEVTPGPEETESLTTASGDWFTVAGWDVHVSGGLGLPVMLTVFMPACAGEQPGEVFLGHRDDGSREGWTECSCPDFNRTGVCEHVKAVSTIIGFADDKETP